VAVADVAVTNAMLRPEPPGDYGRCPEARGVA
jgi:hypothetical protein